MVSYEDCQGNFGAIQFMNDAYFGKDAEEDISVAFIAERAFSRVINEGIKGVQLYLLWNDCCGRDTQFAIEMMLNCPIEKIREHLKLDKRGHATPFNRK